MENYEVTIAMPVYNVSPWVERSLMSALNQTFKSIEFLIIDDKGTDDSMEIVKRIIANEQRGKDVKIIDHIHNQGTGAARNSAIREAKGKFLYFMDSDDILPKKSIETLYGLIQKYKVEIVASSHAICDANYKLVSKNLLYDYKKEKTLLEYCLDENHFNIFTWNKLYDIDFLRKNKIRCIPHHLCEDVFFTFQVIMKCKKFLITSDVTYYYLLNPNSLMGQQANGFSEKLIVMYLEAISEMKKYVESIDFENKKLPDIYTFLLKDAQFLYKSIVSSENITINKKKKYLTQLCNLCKDLFFVSSLFNESHDMRKKMKKISFFNVLLYVKRRLFPCIGRGRVILGD